MKADFRSELISRTRQVLADGSDVEDHFCRFPWLTGALGDPEAGVWFVAENPSLTMVERARNPDGGRPTEDAQWWASRGDKLFRDLLYKHGFKTTPPDEPGGWRCYITNIIKQPDYSKVWRHRSQNWRNEAAERWAPLFAWELEEGNPLLVVALGKTVERILNDLDGIHFTLPTTTRIHHYSYVALRPEGRLGPMHPERVERYDADFARVADEARSLGLANLRRQPASS